MRKKIHQTWKRVKKNLPFWHKEDKSNHKTHEKLDRKFFLTIRGKRYPSLRQFLYIRKVLDSREIRIIQITSGLIVLSIFTIIISYYFNNYESVPAPGGEYTEALVGTPQFINPILAQSDVDKDISRLVFSGLLSFNNLQLEPDLSEKFLISDDQQTYTFILRKNILWHDEEPFTADDVIFTIKRIQDPAFKNPLARTFTGVIVTKLDDYTVQIKTPTPFAPFIYSLTFGILPKHIWKDIPIETAYLSEYNLIPIGTGPFKFKSRTRDKTQGAIKSIRLERNKLYYKEKAKIDAITFKFFETFPEAIEALKQKQVEGLSFLPKTYQEDLNMLDNTNYKRLNLAQYTALFFNQKKNTALAEKNVRVALAHAINKNQIVRDALGGQAEIIHGPILPGFIGYNPNLEKFDFDVEKANTLLDAAGWKQVTIDTYKKEREEKQFIDTTEKKNQSESKVKTDNIVIEKPAEIKTEDQTLQEEFKNLPKFLRKKDNTYLEMEFVTVDNATNRTVLELIAQDVKKIGIKTNLRFVDPLDIRKNILQTRDYEIFLYAQAIGGDPDPYPFWHSSQNEYPGLNLAIFANKEVDKLLEEARAINDTELRKLKYIHFQNILAAEVPSIFLYNPIYVYPITQKIQGFNVRQISEPSDRFSNITDWYIKTRRQRKTR